MKIWLVLLPFFFYEGLCRHRLSGELLKMLKEQYPERRIEKIEKKDFKRWFVVGSQGRATPYRYGYLTHQKHLFPRDTAVVDGYGDIDIPDPLVFFLDKGNYSRYSGVMFELADSSRLIMWTQRGQRCSGGIPGWTDDLKYRPQSYIVNGYLSYNPRDVADLRPLVTQCVQSKHSERLTLHGFDLKQADSSRFSQFMADLHDDHCWTQKERKCVDDQGVMMTASVARKNAILHVDNLTVYAQCCDKSEHSFHDCRSDVHRCSYFIYDNQSGIDFYIDDSLAKEMFNAERVSFFVPAIEADDHFVTKRRNQFTTTTAAPTTTTTTTTTLKPIAIPTAPPRPTPKDNPIEEEYPSDDHGHEDDYEEEGGVRRANSSSGISETFMIALIFVWLTV